MGNCKCNGDLGGPSGGNIYNSGPNPFELTELLNALNMTKEEYQQIVLRMINMNKDRNIVDFIKNIKKDYGKDDD